jgi:HEAT repeat protein
VANAAAHEPREEATTREPASVPEPRPTDASGGPALAADEGEAAEEDLDFEILDAEGDLGDLELEPEEPPFQALLAEFEECEDAELYTRLGERIVELARELGQAGSFDEGWQATVALGAHAGDERKRSAGQRETANLLLGRLLDGAQLDGAIRRAGDASPETSLPAAQVLVQRGEPAAAELLRAAHAEPDAERRERLVTVLAAFGERGAQPILDALESADARLARTALRVASELQDPRATARIEALLERGPAALRPDAARALARLGTPEAFQALARAVESRTPEVAGIAALALASTGERRALAPLVRSLRRALDKGRFDLARERIRALGRLGHADAAPELAELLRQRSLLQRGRLREVQAAALAALAKLPGDVAYGALAQAAHGRDARIRRVAQDALDRRAAPAAAEDGAARPTERAESGRGR